MEILGGIFVAFMLMVVLALLGVATLAAFALMAILGLLTEMSFRRLFFVSFGLGLFAPIMLFVILGSTLNEEEVQRELREELLMSLPGTQSVPPEAIEAIPQILEWRDQMQQGDITAAQFEERLKQLAQERVDAAEAQETLQTPTPPSETDQ